MNRLSSIAFAHLGCEKNRIDTEHMMGLLAEAGFCLVEENENADYALQTSLGLGLYIVREIVLAHKGTLNVTSTEEKGTSFEILLPL